MPAVRIHKWNVCPDCGRNFKSTRGLSVHRIHCAKRPPYGPYHDYLPGDLIENPDSHDLFKFQYGEFPSSANSQNGTSSADSLTRLAA